MKTRKTCLSLERSLPGFITGGFVLKAVGFGKCALGVYLLKMVIVDVPGLMQKKPSRNP